MASKSKRAVARAKKLRTIATKARRRSHKQSPAEAIKSGLRDARDQVAAAGQGEKVGTGTVGEHSAGVRAANNSTSGHPHHAARVGDGAMRSDDPPLQVIRGTLVFDGEPQEPAKNYADVTEKRTTPEGVALTQALRLALSVADQLGVKRAEVARRLGVSTWTLEGYVLSSRPQCIPGQLLVRLLTDDTLPYAAKVCLWTQIARMGRMTVVEEHSVSWDSAHPARQALEISAAVGRVSQVVHAMLDPQSPGGVRCTQDEAKAAMPTIERARIEVVELHETMRRVAEHGGIFEPRS